METITRRGLTVTRKPFASSTCARARRQLRIDPETQAVALQFNQEDGNFRLAQQVQDALALLWKMARVGHAHEQVGRLP
jgi:hypothetical protein